MSDFDKEAERERLREKYENEEEDRAQTQRMSQLLLRGATMTNKHCDRCGTPIFRYDDQEFCPECQDEAAEGAAEAAVDEGPEAAADAVEDAGATDDMGPDERNDGTESANQQAGTPAATADEAVEQVAGATQAAPGPGQTARDHANAEAGDLAGARASLVRTLSSLAQRAEAADDPRRAKELLAAAREAAEAVAALDR